jgi:hypothetical protein
MMIVLQNVASSGFDSLVSDVAKELEKLFNEKMAALASFDPKVCVLTGGKPSWLGKTGVVVYMFNVGGSKFDVVQKATGDQPPTDEKTGGWTSNAPKGAVSEVFFNSINDRANRPVADLAYACFHEIMHNKVETGAALTGVPFKFDGKEIKDIHTEGGGGVFGKPARNDITLKNARMMAAAMPRRIPQWTDLMRV